MFDLRIHGIIVAVIGAISLACIGFVPANADDTGTPVFQPAAGAIVSGLSGLVTGVQQSLSGDRTSSRIMVFRTQLTNMLLKASAGATKIPLGAMSEVDAKEYAISDRSVLCDSRGQHAIMAADATYINTVTGTLDKFAVPPKIQTIGDALGSVFQSYSISAPPGQKETDTATGIVQSCVNDIQNWPASVYGRAIVKAQAQSFGLPLVGLASDLSTVYALYQAVVAIITPIVVTPAQIVDEKRRADAITAFLKNYHTTILKAANDIAVNGTALATQGRLQALGQFAEKMAEFRNNSIDLSKIDTCKTGLANPVLRTENGQDSKGNAVTYNIPSDAFVVCYEQAWAQILNSVQSAVSAAAQYDVLADASSDQLAKAVQTIKDNFDKLSGDQNADVADLWTAAAQLVAYGQTVSQALSPDNIAKVQTNVNNVMKSFGGK